MRSLPFFGSSCSRAALLPQHFTPSGVSGWRSDGLQGRLPGPPCIVPFEGPHGSLSATRPPFWPVWRVVLILGRLSLNPLLLFSMPDNRLAAVQEEVGPRPRHRVTRSYEQTRIISQSAQPQINRVNTAIQPRKIAYPNCSLVHRVDLCWEGCHSEQIQCEESSPLEGEGQSAKELSIRTTTPDRVL